MPSWYTSRETDLQFLLEARLSQSKPGYGLIRYRSLTKNQDDKVVQSFIAVAFLPTSGSSSTSSS